MWGQSKEDGGELGSAVCWGSFLPMSKQVGCPGHSTAPCKTPKRVGPPLCHQGKPHWDGTGLVERVPGWEGGNVFQSCPGKAQARVGESEGGCPLRRGAAEVKILDLHTDGQADVWKGTEPHPQTQASVPPREALFRPPAGASPHPTAHRGSTRPGSGSSAEHPPSRLLARVSVPTPCPSQCPLPLGSPWLGRNTHSHLSSTGRALRNFSLPPPLPPPPNFPGN